MAKILIVGPTIWSIWHFRGALLGSLVELGHEVIACAPHEVREELDAVTASGVRYIPLQIERASLSIYSNLNSCYQLFKILREERPKAVLAYTVKPIIFAGAATFLTRTQCYFAMVTGLGHSLRATSFLHKLLTFVVELLYRIALKKVTKIFFQNIDDRNYFEAHNIISRKHEAILVNGSGVDLTYFSSCPLPDKPVFAILTRLLVSKGVREFYEASKILKSKYPQARFLIGGDLDCNPASLKKDELELWIAEGVIEYYGWVTDVKHFLSKAQVYVLPSYGEGLPRSVLEAMSMGRPIITTLTSGCKETVVHDHNGLLIEPKSVRGLVAAMEYFILNQNFVSTMGSNSRKIAEEKYDVDSVNQILIESMGLK